MTTMTEKAKRTAKLMKITAYRLFVIHRPKELSNDSVLHIYCYAFCDKIV